MADHDEDEKALDEQLKSVALDVEDALSYHIDWKRRLRDAVSLGYCELDSEEVGRDDLCDLGRWLATLPAECRADAWCEGIVELHARFHREAAVVVQFIEAGRIDEARAAMDADTEFDRASQELVGLLEMWRSAA